MNQRLTSWPSPARVLAAAAAVAAVVLPLTARTQSDASAEEIFKQERALCLAGKTNQSTADCLYEARSVLRDRRAGGLEPGNMDTSAIPYDTTGGAGSTSNADALPPRADRN